MEMDNGEGPEKDSVGMMSFGSQTHGCGNTFKANSHRSELQVSFKCESRL